MDLIAEGFDVALRGGPVPDATTRVVRKLTNSQRVLLASPAYLERHGRPRRPRDLREHQCVLLSHWTPHGQWTLLSNRRKVQVPVRGRVRVRVNDLETVKLAAVAGYGIAQHFQSMCDPELQAGALEEVLPGCCLPEGSLWVVYPSRRHLTPAVRAFVDHLVAHVPQIMGENAPRRAHSR